MELLVLAIKLTIWGSAKEFWGSCPSSWFHSSLCSAPAWCYHHHANFKGFYSVLGRQCLIFLNLQPHLWSKSFFRKLFLCPALDFSSLRVWILKHGPLPFFLSVHAEVKLAWRQWHTGVHQNSFQFCSELPPVSWWFLRASWELLPDPCESGFTFQLLVPTVYPVVWADLGIWSGLEMVRETILSWS